MLWHTDFVADKKNVPKENENEEEKRS